MNASRSEHRRSDNSWRRAPAGHSFGMAGSWGTHLREAPNCQFRGVSLVGAVSDGAVVLFTGGRLMNQFERDVEVRLGEIV